MKTRILIGGLVLATLIAVVFYAAPFQGGPAPLAGYFPSGALLYLEAKDFSAELRAWEGSEEQRRWLASARYQGFLRSNLSLKLQQAWTEFTGAAGFEADAKLANSLAGSQSAVAIYDIGDLAFLYVTRLASAQAMQTALWQARTKYETRHAGGVDFFVRVDSGRTVAFAVTGGYLILGTREELVAGALRLLAGEALTTVAQESWYRDSTGGAGAAGDLRLVTNLEELVKSPQFRSYWIQRNTTEIRDYRAGISDLVRSGGEFREERLLLRKSAAAAPAANAEGLFQLVPDGAAFARASAEPTEGRVAALVEDKLLAPKVTARLSQDFAPPADSEDTGTGQESNLETRIDEPPMAREAPVAMEELQRLLSTARLEGILQVQSGEPLADGVFVNTPAVIVVQAARPWDTTAVQHAVSAAAASLWTSGGIGTGWTARQRGARTWYAMDGLASLQLAVEGNLLLLGNSEAFSGAVMDRIGSRSATGDATSIVVFRHLAARGDYAKLTQALDHAEPAVNRPFGFPGENRPAFFSVDLWSLSGIFGSVREIEMRARDTGEQVRETISYRRGQ